MNNLTEFNKDKKTLIKLINQHRLENRNKWYKVSVSCEGFNYEMKCFDTWVQRCHVYKKNKLISTESSAMELTPTNFKQYLNNLIR